MECTDSKIKIAIMSKPLDNWKSGSGHHLDELVRSIAALNDPSLEIHLVHYKKSDNPIYSQFSEILIPRNPFKASRILAKYNFDLIHYSPLSVFAPIWKLKAKKTATVHGIEEVLYPQGYSFIHRFHDTKIHPLYMRAMDGIATVSETSKNYFVEKYKIKPSNIIVTYNALSEEYRLLTEAEKKAASKEIPQKKYVLHISRYSKRKNPDCIMGGFAKYITKTGDDIVLVCAGKGWDSEEALLKAEHYGIKDRYIAPGFIDTKTAVALLNSALVFLFPSFAEGFGMPNIEAMAAGCPVITSAIFAIPEIVADAAVLLPDPRDQQSCADAIERINTNENFRLDLVQKGFNNIKRFDWNQSANKLINFWKNLVK